MSEARPLPAPGAAPIRPRALVHAGRVLAAGVLLELDARRRALALWTPGVRCFAVEGGLYLRFAHPRLLDAARAPGHPVVDLGGLLATAPLSAAERAALDAPPGALALVRAGIAVAVPLGPELEPADWLELSPALVSVTPLGAPPLAPAAPPPPPRDLRTLLAVPQPSAEAAEFERVLARVAQGRSTGARAAGRAVAASVAGAAAAASAGLRGLGAALRRLLAMGARGERGARAQPSSGAARRAAAPAAPRRSGLAAALGRLRDRLLVTTRIARIAGMRQAAYLGRLFSHFERGELDEALRRAIPLGGASGPEDRLALGLPAIRDRLEITPTLPGAGASLGLGGGLYEEMQRLYRRAFELLDARGDAERAAFVLAELLRASEEAVSYLERKGKLRLAAELAEARGLPPGLIVRQWFLAGDVARAVAAARARGAWADAVARLERTQRRREALALRLVWAEDLAEAGLLEAAVETARPVPEAVPLLLRWVEAGIAAGGPSADALAVRLLELAPERFPEVRARALEACADAGDDGSLRRAALLRGLRSVPRSDATRALARPLLRGVLGDVAQGAAPAADERELLDLAADPALRDDLPPRKPAGAPSRPPILLPASGPPQPLVLSHALAHDDAGARPALDAAVLPGGRVLVALGEAGAVLLARDGRTLARLDAPAHELVVSDAGTRALALAPRGDTLRISRLDLEARTAAPIRDLPLHAVSRSYDGALWLTATRDAVMLLDALSGDLRSLWRVGGLPGTPFALARDAAAATFVTAGEALEGWHYELPDPTLRGRTPLAPPQGWVAHAIRLAGARGRWFSAEEHGEGTVTVREHGTGRAHVVPDAHLLRLEAGTGVVAVAVSVPDGVEVHALDPALLAGGLPPERGVLARVSLRRAARAALRIEGMRLTICDDRGRILALDLAAGRLTHDLRI